MTDQSTAMRRAIRGGVFVGALVTALLSGCGDGRAGAERTGEGEMAAGAPGAVDTSPVAQADTAPSTQAAESMPGATDTGSVGRTDEAGGTRRTSGDTAAGDTRAREQTRDQNRETASRSGAAKPAQDTTRQADSGAADTAAAAPAPAQESPAAPQPAPTQAQAPAQDNPYRYIPKDTVSQVVYDGWKQYELNCARCHGEYAVGSSFAPALVVSARENGTVPTKEAFIQVVCAGRKEKGMPAWCELGLEMSRIEAIYQYVKGRADGKISPGRPAVRPDA